VSSTAAGCFPVSYAPNCHLSLVLASVVQGDAVNTPQKDSESWHRRLKRCFWMKIMNEYPTCNLFQKSEPSNYR